MPVYLPDELWDRIVQHLPSASLASLRRTCRRFSVLAEPHLYEKVSFVERKDEEIPGQISRLYLFLCSIASRPERAGYTKYFQFHQHKRQPSNDQPLWDEDSFQQRFTSHEIGLIDNWIQTTNVAPRVKLQELKRGSADAIVALLLSRFHHCSELDLRLTRQDRTYVRAILRSTPRPATLKRVSVGANEAWEETCSLSFSDDVAHLFEIPAIQFLKITCVQTTAPNVWPGTQPVALPLTTLVLDEGFVTDSHLFHILAATPNLKTLDCRLAYDANTRESCDCARLQSALEKVKPSLENLRIAIEFWISGNMAIEAYQGGDYGIIGRVKSLKEFNLKNLEFPFVLLQGWLPDQAPPIQTVVPNTLETLCIRDDMAAFEDYVWTIPEMTEEMIDYLLGLPSLKEFTFKPFSLDIEFGNPYDDRLRLSASVAGIGCSIVNYAFEKGEVEDPWYPQFVV